MTSIRDRLWLWCHPVNSHIRQFGLSDRPSRIEPADAARWLGIANAVMVVYADNPSAPFEPHQRPLDGLQRVVWSVIGDSSSQRNDGQTNLEEVLTLAARHDNIRGAIIDDLFNEPADRSRRWRVDASDLSQMAARLHGEPGTGARRLDLWGVLYAHQLELPIAQHLAALDVVTFWNWHAHELADLESSFARCEQLTPGQRRMLGCYMWDYGGGQPMPLDRMEQQCRLGSQWLRDGRIEGMIFLASCICDLDIPAVEWTRQWIAGA